MRKTPFVLTIVCLSFFVLGFSQTDVSLETTNDTQTEFEILVNYLQENGNFINSDLAPALITPDELKKNVKNEKFLVLDIRSDSWFEYGHIKNAKNAAGPELLGYFENKITPLDYEKIVIVCYSGQSASYYTSLLRLMGYDNVYSLKWGMSSWRVDFAENSWLKNISNDFADKLETAVNLKPEKGAFPELRTGKTTGKDILRARLTELFEIPYKEFILKSEAIFEAPEEYFVMHYWGEENYALGHIPGAIHYQPQFSLDMNNELSTLPVDRKIAVYGENGLDAAYAVAYLNVLGYDVGNIAYGANGFMNKVLKNENWGAFTKKEVNMYPVIE
ncbi:MAG: rhodanese-like domain-containing protein [Flavobacteriaceae bacterium]|nr:rhodanese-like domain-containing protein [Flavobacteriaceae bacterium]